MCCRIKTSGAGARTIVGLYIFLASFLIGFFAVQVDSLVDLYLWTEPSGLLQAGPIQESLHNEIAPLAENKPLLIKYRCSLIGRERLDAMFSVTNVGSKPITFEKVQDWGTIVTLRYPSGETDRVIADEPYTQLDPGETSYLSARVRDNNNTFDLSLQYRYGERYVYIEEDQSIHVENQHDSFQCR